MYHQNTVYHAARIFRARAQHIRYRSEYGMLFSIINTALSIPILHHISPYYTILHHTIPYYIILYHTSLPYYSMLYHTLPILHPTPYYTRRYGVELLMSSLLPVQAGMAREFQCRCHLARFYLPKATEGRE